MIENAGSRKKVGLSQCETDTYHEEGLVIPDYKLPPAKLARLREGLEQLIKDNPNIRSEKLISAHLSGYANEGVRGNRIFLDFATDPDLLDLVECVIGPDMILWGAQVFCKPAGDGMEVPWHQDGQYWPIRHRLSEPCHRKAEPEHDRDQRRDPDQHGVERRHHAARDEQRRHLERRRHSHGVEFGPPDHLHQVVEDQHHGVRSGAASARWSRRRG